MHQHQLHICNGHATARLLAASEVTGARRLYVDVLLEGPCPPIWGEPWREVRAEFMSGPEGFGGTAPGADGAPKPDEELSDDDLARALARPDELDEIVLWYEHDLYDQLLLIRLLASIARHAGPRPSLSLVSVGEHAALPRFQGLGQLSTEQLASLFETRLPIDDRTIALGNEAWATYTDSDPRLLEALLERDLSALPFLARALRRHLQEYPGVHDGLSRTERGLLTLVQGGLAEPARVWRQLHASEDCHYIADSWFMRLVRRLTAPPAPLLAVDTELTLPLTREQALLTLTPLGEEVLRGRVDWLAHFWFDRWLGGVHLTDARSAWRWDPISARLTRPPGAR
jgi:hypothetical protein